jgi:hypothetical protein
MQSRLLRERGKSGSGIHHFHDYRIVELIDNCMTDAEAYVNSSRGSALGLILERQGREIGLVAQEGMRVTPLE